MKLEFLTASMVNQAVDIYLQQAYDDEELRQSHLVHFDEDMPIEKVLASWEREDARLRSYSLRLGCQHYPHMKLALWEAYSPGEFVFAVDRHDGFDFERTGPGYEQWVGIKSKNFQVKTTIENTWYEAGLPTMRRLKDEKLSQSDILAAFSGREVLVVDNDADACAIIEMILSSAGYGCCWTGSVAEAVTLLEDGERRERCGMALVDLMLSDGSGIDVVNALRACPATQEIPIVLTSAMSPQDVALGAADGYLQKPYSADDLLASVAQTIHRRFEERGRFVEHGEQKG